MIAVLKNTATREQINSLINWFEDKGLKVNESKGEFCTVLGLIGDTSTVDIDMLQGLDIIEKVTRVSETFKKANRKFHPEDTVIDVGGVKIGGGNFAVIAGPCSVESEEQIMNAAKAVKACGATILRGGAFKPRTSPYDFQGLHEEGIKLLLEATYSSFVRHQTNKLYSDLEFSREVQAEIDKAINEFTKEDRVKINSGWQDLGNEDISDVFDDFTGPPFPAYYSVNVKKLKSKRYKFTIKRHSIFPGTDAPLSLSVQPWLLRAGLCDRLDFSIPEEYGNDALEYLAKSGETGTFDKLVVRNEAGKKSSVFSFFRNGSVVLGFTAEKIFFNKPTGKHIG